MDALESHPVPDTVDPSGWRLHVTGAVSQPLRLALEDLRALPCGDFSDDFTCVEGWRARDLSWHGVSVGSVLARAKPTQHATDVLVRAMDGDYASSFPLDRARSALIAIELEGEAVPLEHGGPARLVPTGGDADCWESVKWVSEIEVLTANPTDRDTAETIALNRGSTPTE
ncbi:molybdopterin-dependent oxidoreductase [Halobacterium noricense]|nr:molybdopterin-dependent oxidoreductase [Halobaculum roseum]